MVHFHTIAVFLLLGCSAVVMCEEQVDYTLRTVGRSCMDKFQSALVDLYASDKACQDAITNAWSSPGKQCPSTKIGSEVHKCLSKSDASVKRWVDFVKDCEVMNVAVRDEQSTVAVESESAAPKSSESESTPAGGEAGGEHAKPSCFAAWEEWEDFQKYLQGKKSGAVVGANMATGLGIVLSCLGAIGLHIFWL